MPAAWDSPARASAPGGKGVKMAVLDTGVAYERFRRFRRAPDLNRFVRGYDFVDEGPPPQRPERPRHACGGHDRAEHRQRDVATAGIAYRAKIMPVRVLDADGAGDTFAISRGIRFAARKGAKVINLSLEFDSSVRASRSPTSSRRCATPAAKGSLVVAAAGNQADTIVAYPARAKNVVAVAATTIRGCQADYSNSGVDVDLTAPGGGVDAANADPQDPYRPRSATPTPRATSSSSRRSLAACAGSASRAGYEGTSMAAPHVSGVAALVIASKRLGRGPNAAHPGAPPRDHRPRPRAGRASTPLRQRAARRRGRAAVANASAARCLN